MSLSEQDKKFIKQLLDKKLEETLSKPRSGDTKNTKDSKTDKKEEESSYTRSRFTNMLLKAQDSVGRASSTISRNTLYQTLLHTNPLFAAMEDTGVNKLLSKGMGLASRSAIGIVDRLTRKKKPAKDESLAKASSNKSTDTSINEIKCHTANFYAPCINYIVAQNALFKDGTNFIMSGFVAGARSETPAYQFEDKQDDIFTENDTTLYSPGQGKSAMELAKLKSARKQSGAEKLLSGLTDKVKGIGTALQVATKTLTSIKSLLSIKFLLIASGIALLLGGAAWVALKLKNLLPKGGGGTPAELPSTQQLTDNSAIFDLKGDGIGNKLGITGSKVTASNATEKDLDGLSPESRKAMSDIRVDLLDKNGRMPHVKFNTVENSNFPIRFFVDCTITKIRPYNQDKNTYYDITCKGPVAGSQAVIARAIQCIAAEGEKVPAQKVICLGNNSTIVYATDDFLKPRSDSPLKYSNDPNNIYEGFSNFLQISNSAKSFDEEFNAQTDEQRATRSRGLLEKANANEVASERYKKLRAGAEKHPMIAQARLLLSNMPGMDMQMRRYGLDPELGNQAIREGRNRGLIKEAVNNINVAEVSKAVIQTHVMDTSGKSGGLKNE